VLNRNLSEGGKCSSPLGLRYEQVLKVKVKLFLCLTKHHAMKAYWVVEVLLHAFFDLSTRWR
jgi:hypothetical protein